MIGIQYLKYHPNEIPTLETGLTIAGPHSEFTKVNLSVNFAENMIYVNPIVRDYNRWIGCKNEIPLLLEKSEIYNCVEMLLDFSNNESYVKRRVSKVVKIFEEIVKAGTEINYRCLDCHDCTECRKEALLRKSVSKRILSNKLLKKVFPLILK